MTPTTSPHLGQIHALLAEKGYEVSEPAPDTIKIREVDSGVSIQAGNAACAASTAAFASATFPMGHSEITSPMEGLKIGVRAVWDSIHSPPMKNGQGSSWDIQKFTAESPGSRDKISPRSSGASHPRDNASDCFTNSSPLHSPSALTTLVAVAAFCAALRSAWRLTRSACVVK